MFAVTAAGNIDRFTSPSPKSRDPESPSRPGSQCEVPRGLSRIWWHRVGLTKSEPRLPAEGEAVEAPLVPKLREWSLVATLAVMTAGPGSTGLCPLQSRPRTVPPGHHWAEEGCVRIAPDSLADDHERIESLGGPTTLSLGITTLSISMCPQNVVQCKMCQVGGVHKQQILLVLKFCEG